MTVIARDQGAPPLQGQAVINIQVMVCHRHKREKGVLRCHWISTQLESEGTLNVQILFLESIAHICAFLLSLEKWLDSNKFLFELCTGLEKIFTFIIV